jgi:hypothetical protein
MVIAQMREEHRRLTGDYRFFPAIRLAIDAYPRRRNARSIPSSTTSWIFSRFSKAIFRRAA